MAKCVVCGREGETEDHHTSYQLNIKVPACHECHVKIHSGKTRPDLKPTDKRSDLFTLYMKTSKEIRDIVGTKVLKKLGIEATQQIVDLIDIAYDVTLEALLEDPTLKGGRHKKELDVESMVALRNSTTPPMSYAKIAEKMGCAVGTVINRLKDQGAYAPMFKKLPGDGPEVQSSG